MEAGFTSPLCRRILMAVVVFSAFSILAGPAFAESAVAIVVEDILYPEIATEVNTHKSDLEAEGYSVQIILVGPGSNTPGGMRALLQGVPNIVAAYFIGDIAVATFEHADDFSGYASFPCDAYYMDIDGTWLDVDSDGKFDVHMGGSKMSADIWVARIKTGNLGKIGSEVGIIKTFFGKAHGYRTGTFTRSKAALEFVDDDWSLPMGETNSLKNMYGESNVTVVNDPSETSDDYYESLLAEDRELIQLYAHSTATWHGFQGVAGGNTTNEEIIFINPLALYYSLFCCSAGRITAGNCLAACYTFVSNGGLATQASSKTGSLCGTASFFSYMAGGHTFGDAFLQAAGFGSNTSNMISWSYGLTLFGDPSLGPKVGIVMPNPKVFLRDSTTGIGAYTDSTLVDVIITYDRTAAAWLLSETQNTQPNAGHPDWVGVKPATFELSLGDGFKRVYAWVKNADGVINSGASGKTTLDTVPPAASANPSGRVFANPVEVKLSATDKSGISAIYYTTDGSDPDCSSTVYSSPVTIDKDTVLKSFAVDKTGDVGAINSETYTFDDTLVEITVDTEPAGRTITVNGIDYTAPQIFAWAEGANQTIGVVSPQPVSASEQYVFSSWSDGGAEEHTITVSPAPATYKATFKLQHALNALVNPAGGGTVTPSGITWHDVGSTVNLTASPNPGYVFVMWAGHPVANRFSANTTITMDFPKSVVALFQETLTTTVTTSPEGLTVTVDGMDCTAPQTFTWAEGTDHTVGVSSPQAGGAGTQYVFSAWSDAGAMEHTITVPSTSTTYTADFTTRYYLSIATSPPGLASISGEGWCDSGDAAVLDAAPASVASAGKIYCFIEWEVDGMPAGGNPPTITMDGPKSAVAKYQIGELAIDTALLPDAEEGIDYNAALQASEGAEPYSWSLDLQAGEEFPPGLSLAGGGNLTGVPTENGTYAFTVKVQDGNAPPQEATRQLSLAVAMENGAFIVEPAALPEIIGSGGDTMLSFVFSRNGHYWLRLGGDGTKDNGTAIGMAPDGSFLASELVQVTIPEADIPDNTTALCYVVIETTYRNSSDNPYPGEAFHVTDDQIPPTSMVSSPTMGSKVGSVISIAGTAYDNGGSIVRSVEISIFDGLYYFGGTGFDSVVEIWHEAGGTNSWSFDSSSVPWEDNINYTINSRATDNVSNVELPGAGIVFLYDSVAPAVTINSVSATVIGPDVSTIINWQVNENCTYFIEAGGDGSPGSGTTISSGICIADTPINSTITCSDLPADSETTIFIIAVGAALDYGYSTQAIINDLTEPVAAIKAVDKRVLAHKNSKYIYYVENPPKTVSGTAADSGGSVLSAVEVAFINDGLYFDGTSFGSVDPIWLTATGRDSWSCSIPFDATFFTQYTIEARAIDAVGNVQSVPATRDFTCIIEKKKRKGGCSLGTLRNHDPEDILGYFLPFFLLIAMITTIRRSLILRKWTVRQSMQIQ